MRKIRMLVVVAATLVTGACYHVTVETGKAPNGQTISRPWALGFIYGLIPPPTVNTAAQCPDGVSKVESQMSFLNGLVAALTFSIITPMQIDVACASRGAPDGLLPPEVPFSVLIAPVLY